MTPVFQTKLPPKHKVGNCLAAVVASLFDLSIDEVPNFEVLGEGELWKVVLGEWSANRGFYVLPAPELLYYEQWHGEYPHDCENVPYICYGEVLGVAHVVIKANGRLVHDPTPKGAGLDVTSAVWVLCHKLVPPVDGRAFGDLLRLDHITYSPVPQIPDYDA